jgi:predicted transcriptional regulator YdeE
MKPHRFQNGKPMILAGLRRKHDTGTAGSSIARQWSDFLALDPVFGRVGTHYYGAMCGGDSSGFEYLSGVEVNSFERLPDFERYEAAPDAASQGANVEVWVGVVEGPTRSRGAACQW